VCVVVANGSLVPSSSSTCIVGRGAAEREISKEEGALPLLPSSSRSC